MKSMTLLQWAGGQLTEVSRNFVPLCLLRSVARSSLTHLPIWLNSQLARDYNAHWMTAISFLDDDTFLGAENRMNVFVARKRAEAPTEEERGRLEVRSTCSMAQRCACRAAVASRH